MKTPTSQCATAAPTPERSSSTLLVDIEVPFLDVHADDLRWALNLPTQAALSTAHHHLPVPHPEHPARRCSSGAASGAVSEPSGLSGFRVETRILGASHQVLIHPTAHTSANADRARTPFSETVACELGDTPPLPRAHTLHNPSTQEPSTQEPSTTTGSPGPENAWWSTYELRSYLAHLKPRPFAAAVNALAAPIPDTTALVAQFPGHPDAVTGIRLHTTLAPAGLHHMRGSHKHQPTKTHIAPWVIAWTTWHAYPQAGQLVTTHATLTIPAH